jgi:NADH-quinone oxidoreductase subunit C
MSDLATLIQRLNTHFADVMTSCKQVRDEVTIEIPADKMLSVAKVLRDEPELNFECAMDVCGVDYLTYGVGDWQTDSATSTGFDRGVEEAGEKNKSTWTKPRYAVVYHLLSIHHNWRLRLRVLTDGEPPIVDSLISVWNGVNWFEREAFDMYGIFFRGHPDLRRILTDYGFVGYPMRKDFPVTGNVEVRYDHEQGRVIYQPVTIKERILVPRVIRDDNRYVKPANNNDVEEANA